jgi:hypothetical protein
MNSDNIWTRATWATTLNELSKYVDSMYATWYFTREVNAGSTEPTMDALMGFISEL